MYFHGFFQRVIISLREIIKFSQPEIIHGTDWGPLHIFNRYTAWSSCGTSNNRSRGCLWLSCLDPLDPLDPLPLTGQPCLASTKEQAPSPIWYGKAGWYPGCGRVSPSLRKGGGYRGGKREELEGEEGGEVLIEI